ncbi:amidohydrolase [Fusobacterium perfoetens]|uniref:amidohydrolase n=1 Tax=Fusobacterium perfoetens TaxID=852 RepID=UPI0026ED5634|nr:amidohydrolase [Fusobacterium perfoetens]
MKLFKNGKIYTLDRENKIVDSILVEEGKIVGIGREEELIKKLNGGEIIDLEGKTVIPAFNDSHVHFVNYGYNKKKIPLYSCRSVEDVVKIGKEKFTVYGGWVLGRGWNQDLFIGEKRMPTREDLDKISTEYPICFTRTCGHVAVVNTKALEVCGITKDTKCSGGDVDYEKGTFSENGLYLVYSHIPSPSLEELKTMLVETQEEFFSMGITSVQTDDFETFPDKDFAKIIKAYTELEKEGKLKIKVTEQCLFPEIEKIKRFNELGYTFGYGSKNFRIGPIKLLLDGSLGGKTAFLQKPYIDNDKNYGIATYTIEEFEKVVTLADSLGYQVAVHAIGDGAIKMCVDAFEKLPNLNNKRHGIVHCQITTNELMERMKKLNILAYIQPIFLDYDLHIVEDRVGYERSLETYAWNTMRKLNIPMAFGSDSPVDTADVIKALHCAVNRQDISFRPAEKWLPNEALPIVDAIKYYTVGGAFASFEENLKGTIEVGKLADFVVLSENIIEIHSEDILKIKIDTTVVEGNIVYNRK